MRPDKLMRSARWNAQGPPSEDLVSARPETLPNIVVCNNRHGDLTAAAFIISQVDFPVAKSPWAALTP